MLVREFEVHDFGPIREGRVEIGDLTLLIGPQNSGKTYLSMLLYALAELGARIFDLIIDETVDFLHDCGIRGHIGYETIRDIISQHQDEIKRRMIRVIKRTAQRFMTSELRASFLIHDLDILVRKGSEKARVLCSYKLGEHVLRISMNIGRELVVKDVVINEGMLPDFVSLLRLSADIRERGPASLSFVKPSVGALYVPTDRFVILSSLSSYISLLLDIHRHIFERATIAEALRQAGFGVRKPLLDYIRIVDTAIKESAFLTRARLSGSVLGTGNFLVEEGRIWYEDPHGVKIPVELASSGVAQLIGILLPVSAVFSPYLSPILLYHRCSMVIVEEPEVNLHADLHIEVARFLPIYRVA